MSKLAPQILVIGYGNTLRSDDGVGYQVAEAIATWNLPQVHALAVHQLTPELAEAIAQSTVVIFIDAAVTDISVSDVPMTELPTPAATSQLGVQMERLLLDDQVSFTTHVATPNALLLLAQRLYQAEPIAYQVTIPAICFAIGESLSTITVEGKENALNHLEVLLRKGIDVLQAEELSSTFIPISDHASRIYS